MIELPREQQLFSSKDGSQWIPHLDGKPRNDIEDWLHQNLTWDEFQAIVNPPKTTSQLFSEEFAALKSEYDADIQSLNMAFASAAMVDGEAQETKQASIRDQYNARKAKYNTAFAALRTKYYG